MTQEMMTDAFNMAQDYFSVFPKVPQEQFQSVAVEIADTYELDLSIWLDALVNEIQYLCY